MIIEIKALLFDNDGVLVEPTDAELHAELKLRGLVS